MNEYKEGDLEDKGYQKILIDTFVKAVYLWDDRIRIDYYYAGKGNSVTLNLPDSDSDRNKDPGVRLMSSTGEHETGLSIRAALFCYNKSPSGKDGLFAFLFCYAMNSVVPL